MNHVVSLNNPSIASQIASQKREEISFTDKTIKYLKPSDKRRIVWSTGNSGLGLRISPNGRKTFIYMYKFETRDRMISLGVYPKMKLSRALEKYAEFMGLVERGIDPGDQHVDDHTRTRQAPTVKQLANSYIKKYAKINKKTWAEDERILELDIIPQLGAMKASTVTKKHIIARIDEIVARGAPVSANRTLGVVKAMFRWAVDRDLLTASPCDGVKRPYKEKPKDRFLRLDEVKTFWARLPDAPMHGHTQLALKLLLVTMQRSNEVLGINIKEFDLVAETWIIPSERAKNNQPHLVPLSPPAIEIIKELLPDATDDGFLFPGRWDNTLMSETALSHAVRDNLVLLGLEKFTPHDLRRTGSTLLGAFRVSRFDRERVLNHADSSIGAVYDIYDYEDEKRAALNLWADIILKCAESDGSVNEKALKAKLKYRDYFED